MLSKKMQQALNGQINKELNSAYLYLGMAAAMAERGLGGFAHWFRVQEGEERGHALKVFDYLVQQGAGVALEAVAKPVLKDTTPQALVAATLEHERFITRSVNALVDLAQAERDHATNAFLQWYVTEQVEEEANAQEILNFLALLGDSKQGLVMLDRQLAQRK